ncbi:hypothetical protein EJ377_18170 [Chryseobacterium arthrosphaerae]|uniref:Uncharacterized protein n=1 Tax=Chryseobacterium arthrosphaerae TaxID=651561 RepID=A0A432DT36_9FLAO|nr:hypothetical protein EJ377_18170 [Chryseobacterium arthrosphaerae]
MRGSQAVVYAYSAIPDAFVNIYLQDGQEKDNGKKEIYKRSPGLYLSCIREKNITNIMFSLCWLLIMMCRSVCPHECQNEKDPLKIELTTFRDKVEPGSKENGASGSQEE